MKKFSLLALLMVVLFPLFAQAPISTEASIVKINSNGDVEMRATGIYHSTERSAMEKQIDVNYNGSTLATEDAKKAAIYTLLFSAVDPILSTDTSRERFRSSGAFVYEKGNIDKYIVSVDKNTLSSTPLNDGQSVKVTVGIVVNRNALTTDLTAMGVLDRPQIKVEDSKVPEKTDSTQKPQTKSIDRQKLRSATMKAIADIPSKTTIVITDVESSFKSIDDIDIPDLLIDVLIELNYKVITLDRVDQIKREKNLPKILNINQQVELGRFAGANYIINVLISEGTLRVQCINVATSALEGRGTVELD